MKNTPRGYCICPEGGIKLKKETYDVTGMSCAACSSRVEKAVAKQPGAQQVAVNLLKNSMVVEYDESQLSSAQIIAAVEKAGYGASLHAKPGSAPAAQTAETGGASAAQKAYSDMKKRLALSLIFTIPLFYLSMGHMMGWPLPACWRRSSPIPGWCWWWATAPRKCALRSPSRPTSSSRCSRRSWAPATR